MVWIRLRKGRCRLTAVASAVSLRPSSSTGQGTRRRRSWCLGFLYPVDHTRIWVTPGPFDGHDRSRDRLCPDLFPFIPILILLGRRIVLFCHDFPLRSDEPDSCPHWPEYRIRRHRPQRPDSGPRAKAGTRHRRGPSLLCRQRPGVPGCRSASDMDVKGRAFGCALAPGMRWC